MQRNAMRGVPGLAGVHRIPGKCYRTTFQRSAPMRNLVLAKASFWLIVIGAIALVTPHPAWPRPLAWAVLATGFTLGAVTLIGKLRRPRDTDAHSGDEK